MSGFDSEAEVQQTVSKLFEKFVSVYFVFRNPLILINVIFYSVLYLPLKAVSTIFTQGEQRSGICLKWTERNFYSGEMCTVINIVNYAFRATFDSYMTRVGL
jgi:hypothetical protein